MLSKLYVFWEVKPMKKFEGWVTAPQGFVTAAVKAGIKASGNLDVTIIKSKVPAATGAVGLCLPGATLGCGP